MKVRSLVEVSLQAAISSVLFLSAVFIPIAGVIISFFCPVPIVVLSMRQSLKRSLVGVLIAALIVGMLSGPFQALWMFLGFGMVGIGIGTLVRMKKSAVEVLIYGTMVSLSSKLLLVGLSLLIFGLNPFSINITQMEKALTSALSMTGSSEDIKTLVDRWLVILQLAIPAIFFLAAVIDTFLAYVVSSNVLKKMGVKMPSLPPFDSWYLPRSMFWGFMAGVVFSWIGGSNTASVWYKIGLNVQIVFSLAFMVYGLSVLYFWLKKVHLPAVVSWIILILIVLQPFISQMLVFLGIFDLWVDFRKLRKGV